MSKELLNALDALETEKGIKKEVIIDALEQALVSAYKKNYGQAQNVKTRRHQGFCREGSRQRSFGFMPRSQPV